MRRPVQIVPYEAEHYAMLVVRAEQAGELERMGQLPGAAAEYGPAFSAVELDDDGHVAKVFACGGLAEVTPPDHPMGGYARAWGAFSEGLRPAQWSAITHAIKGVIDGCGYERVDMFVSPWFDAGRRYALALGFTLDNLVFARRASGEGSA
jgi:hypothetical protein